MNINSASMFKCRLCGHCCEGKGGIIISLDDLRRIAAFLRLTQETVKSIFLETTANNKLRAKNRGSCCIFFNDSIGCEIHEVKPKICLAWPYFRGNLIDPYSFELAKDFCPGIQPDSDFLVFQKEGLDYLQKHNLLANSSDNEATALYLDDFLKRSQE